MKLKHLFALAALSLSTMGGVEAQDTQSLEQQIAALNNRIATLEAEQISTQQQLQESKTKSFFDKHMKISGYIQVGYEWVEDNTTSFYLKRARFKVDGDLWKDKLDYCLQIEFASPKIVDAYVRFKPMTQLNVQLGQFKIPFSIENTEYPPLKAEFIEYPMVLTKLVRMNDVCGISSTGRDIGGQLYGSFFKRDGYHILSYNFAVMNGAGINCTDSNKSKDVVGRLMIHPIKNLLLSASYMFSEVPIGNNPYAEASRYGFGAMYNCQRFLVRSEYVVGRTAGVDAHGAYVTAGYRFNAPFTALARWEFFDQDKAQAGYRQVNYSVGVDYQPLKYLRMQLNYTFSTFNREGQGNLNGINLMVSGIF
ncbi:MAG: OprO/OprP family phosphate-selective porin [Alistipes sp.]|nr:OprO/OprP family phosphate-selective porin [Alistipes sp.]MDE6862561.1 OprO/OprP family phosphate-selective porin [Alistipes sp.]